MENQKKKIAYVVTPDFNYSQWTIYNFATFKKSGNLDRTSNITGYGLDKLKPHLAGNETVLRTGKLDIQFILKFNNKDVNGFSEFDMNLTNSEFINKAQICGAVKIVNPKSKR
jgi:hypothetical protein